MSSPHDRPVGLRERKKQKTLWAIQEHALRLFAEQGYDVTTVDQIAAAAEISPSTFFRYFPTKEDVVIEDQYDPLLVRVFAAEPAGRRPLTALRRALRAALAQIGDAERAKILERAKLIQSVPALRARSAENMARTTDLIAESVAARVGRDPAELPVRVFAGAVVGALTAAATHWVEADGAEDMAECVDAAMALLDSGLSLK